MEPSASSSEVTPCIVGIDKPPEMTSHDVVNRVRSIFKTRRVGHSGTLDPMATGVLVVAIGAATRLSSYLTNQDKRYLARIVFGAATDTDDAAGRVIHEAATRDELWDPNFARAQVKALEGSAQQIPPLYSAIKRKGKKAYEQARAGHVIELDSRRIEIYRSDLIAIGDGTATLWAENEETTSPLGPWAPTDAPAEIAERDDLVYWDVDLSVSKGAYIRSIARDLGQKLSCYGHIGALRRIQSGNLLIDECVSLDALASLRDRAALDPVSLLGMRYTIVDELLATAIGHGQLINAHALTLFEGPGVTRRCIDSCVASARKSLRAPADGESIAAVCAHRVIAILRYQAEEDRFHPECVLTGGVVRGRAV